MAYDATAAGSERAPIARGCWIVRDAVYARLTRFLGAGGGMRGWLSRSCERAIGPSWMSTGAGISADWFGLGVIRDVISGVTPHAHAVRRVSPRYEFAFLQCPPTDVDPRTLAMRYRAIILTRPSADAVRMFPRSRAPIDEIREMRSPTRNLCPSS